MIMTDIPDSALKALCAVRTLAELQVWCSTRQHLIPTADTDGGLCSGGYVLAFLYGHDHPRVAGSKCLCFSQTIPNYVKHFALAAGACIRKRTETVVYEQLRDALLYLALEIR